MSDIPLNGSGPSRRGRRTFEVSDRLDRLELGCLLVSAVLVLSGLTHLSLAVFGDRPWEGPLSWRKPATFGLSFGVTLATLVWLIGLLELSPRTRRVVLTVFAADCVVEVTGITVQAWRDVPSHLNTTTPFDAGVAYSLAAGGAVLVATLGICAVAAIRGRARGGPDMALALRWGFILLLVGLAAGVAMIAVGTAVMRSGQTARAYDIAGFLKGFHGVTLHAVLVLPAVAVVTRHLGYDESARVRAVRVAVALYLLAAAVVLVANLATTVL